MCRPQDGDHSLQDSLKQDTNSQEQTQKEKLLRYNHKEETSYFWNQNEQARQTEKEKSWQGRHGKGHYPQYGQEHKRIH